MQRPHLRRGSRGWLALLTAVACLPTARLQALEAVASFGSNPGNLVMYEHLPAGAATPMPLVLVLHGCTQDAAGYSNGAGWTALADALGVALVVAEQQTANNSSRCFNWFEEGDIARGAGEALSLVQMVSSLQARASIDPARIYVSGLSAGGAMTAVLLATYPDLFAAGAVMSGLPYRCGTGTSAAFACMNSASSRTAEQWGDLVRAASTSSGPWPRISIWHGSSDSTVVPANADELVTQWLDVHGLPATPSSTTTVGRDTWRRWDDGQGQTRVEQHLIANMGHGTAVNPGSGPEQCGTAGAYLLDVDICSTLAAARFFGLTAGASSDGGSPADAVASDGADAAGAADALALDTAGTPDVAGGPDATAATGAQVETFSDLDDSGDGLDLAGWTVEGFEVVASDRQATPGSGSGHGRAVAGYSCQAGTFAQHLRRSFALGAQPRLQYWRRLDLRASPNINSSAAFRLRVQGAVVDQQEVSFSSASDADWSWHEVDLTAHAGSAVVVEFEVEATGTVCIEVVADALLDDLRVVDLAGDGGIPADAASPVDASQTDGTAPDAPAADGAMPDSSGADAAAPDAPFQDAALADAADAGSALDARPAEGADAGDATAEEGCGCATSPTWPAAAWLAPWVLALARRRHRP